MVGRLKMLAGFGAGYVLGARVLKDKVGEKSGPNGARSTASSTAGAGAHR